MEHENNKLLKINDTTIATQLALNTSVPFSWQVCTLSTPSNSASSFGAS